MKRSDLFWAVIVISWIAFMGIAMWRIIVEEDREYELELRKLDQLRCNCAEIKP